MQRQSVQSSNLASVGYDAPSKTLEVEFRSGAVWQYAGVPASVHADLIGSDSVGKSFVSNVRDAYPAKRVG